jgi:hypothetical protein
MAQEVAQMVRRRLPVIIFLVNNHGYTIEVEIHDGPYNNIKNWDYAGLVQVFNGEDGRGRGLRATNGRELAGPLRLPLLTAADRRSLNELISWGCQVARANARLAHNSARLRYASRFQAWMRAAKSSRRGLPGRGDVNCHRLLAWRRQTLGKLIQTGPN